ncbi:MAG: hypothetical protein V3V32_04615 [Dehalococcoidia bacterium]
MPRRRLWAAAVGATGRTGESAVRPGAWLAICFIMALGIMFAVTLNDNTQKDQLIETLEAQVLVLEARPETAVFRIEYQRPGDFLAPEGYEVFTDTDGLPEGLMRVGVRAK